MWLEIYKDKTHKIITICEKKLYVKRFALFVAMIERNRQPYSMINEIEK